MPSRSPSLPVASTRHHFFRFMMTALGNIRPCRCASRITCNSWIGLGERRGRISQAPSSRTCHAFSPGCRSIRMPGRQQCIRAAIVLVEHWVDWSDCVHMHKNLASLGSEDCRPLGDCIVQPRTPKGARRGSWGYGSGASGTLKEIGSARIFAMRSALRLSSSV